MLVNAVQFSHKMLLIVRKNQLKFLRHIMVEAGLTIEGKTEENREYRPKLTCLIFLSEQGL